MPNKPLSIGKLKITNRGKFILIGTDGKVIKTRKLTYEEEVSSLKEKGYKIVGKCKCGKHPIVVHRFSINDPLYQKPKKCSGCELRDDIRSLRRYLTKKYTCPCCGKYNSSNRSIHKPYCSEKHYIAHYKKTHNGKNPPPPIQFGFASKAVA